jgi:hypothetical protein
VNTVSPQDAIDTARKFFLFYFDTMVKLHDERFATMMNHALIHVPDDVENNHSHMGGLSAYPFENFQRTLFSAVRVICPTFIYPEMASLPC